ncbi:MAG: hypothetical protein ABI906_03215, partial [Pseudomonadota bacterium]
MVGANAETANMTQIHWLNQVSASFNTAADWSTGTVPGAGDNAFLDAAGSTAYTVTASTSETVLSLQLADTATLAITFGTFTSAGFNGSVNAGTITVSNGATFSTVGPVSNSGTIELGSTGFATTLVLSSSANLTGGGTISLSDNAGNTIELPKHAIVTNVDNTIVGSGLVTGPAGSAAVFNEAGGVIDADNKTPLTFKIGVNNAGLIETTGKGHCTIKGELINTGLLEANGGKLALKQGAAGSGSAVISAGTIDAEGAFSQNVSFTGRSGKLELARSDLYAASTTGFSLAGKISLDLGDIGFVSSSEASFSGTATSGVLTVTDGSHTAHIHLTGDYRASTFIASSDGNGRTLVATSTSPSAAAAHRFIAAAAGLARSAGEAI